MLLTELKVNQIKTPIGYCLNPLSFSWKVTGAVGKQQRWARICIYQDLNLIYDSGEKAEANSLDFPVDMALQPRTRYTWTLEVTTDSGETAHAQSWFETGKMDETWFAKWISPDDAAGMNPVVKKRFFFVPDTEQTEGRLYICGLGIYEAFLNGQKVGDELLAPGYHSYDLHVQSNTYDVSGLLKAGENELCIVLGEGWFKGSFGFDRISNLYGDRLYAIAELYAGGKGQVLRLQTMTDETWTTCRSPITFAGIYDGECYDARLEKECDEQYPVYLQQPKVSALSDRYSLPVVRKEKLQSKLIWTPKHEAVLDFGQNMTGWVEFDAKLPKNVKIRLTAGEILQDGCFYHENYRTAKAEYIYISSGKFAHVRPHFTYYAFRYMKVEYEDEAGNSLPAETMMQYHPHADEMNAWHIRSDIDQIGTIRTGNEKVNQLFANVLWSQKDNFLDVPTDCPQRDERLGWTGDAQVFSDTACYNMDTPAFYRKYLWDMRAEQEAAGGAGVNVVPLLKHGMLLEKAVCPWADAAVIIPWNVYRHYGNRSLLAECYPGMKAWVDYQWARDERTGRERLIHDGFHFADWLALDNPQPGPLGATDPYFIASVYYMECAELLTHAAHDLGKSEDEEKYGVLAAEIRQAISRKYLDKGNSTCETQTAEAMIIAFGLDPANNAEHGRKLAEMIQNNGGHLNTGFVGTPFLCPALTKGGQNDTAVSLLLNESYPGWLYAVNMGATTIWERWNSVEADGHMNSEGMNSLNHYAYGSIEGWVYADVCGIRPLMPGYRRASIKPHPDRRLKFADMMLNTAAGRYRVMWRYADDERISYEIEIPFGAEAEVTLNGETRTLLSGQYVF